MLLDTSVLAGAARAAGHAPSIHNTQPSELGVSVLPLSAAVEVIGTRHVLRRILGNVGHPYFVLRLGHADPDHPGPPPTPRLPAEQVVEVIEP